MKIELKSQSLTKPVCVCDSLACSRCSISVVEKRRWKPQLESTGPWLHLKYLGKVVSISEGKHFVLKIICKRDNGERELLPCTDEEGEGF